MKRKITFLIAALMLLTMMASTGTLCATDYSYTFTSKVYDAAGAQTLNGVSWTMAGTGGSYFGYDGTKGQQFGSGSKPYSALSLTTSGISGTITNVVINTSGASSTNATVAISVGSTDFTYSGNTTASLTDAATSYTFTGSASGDITISWAQTSSKAIYIKSITVTYSVGATYSVTYDANGGTIGAVPSDATSYANGATVTVKNRNTLDHTTLGFKGWNTRADGEGTFYHPGATFTMGSANVTLYAVWTTRCTFAYDDNGKTGGAVPSGYYTSYGSGAKVVVVGNTGSLVKTGYAWEGWNTEDDGSGTDYVAGNSFIISNNTTLYAKWRELATYELVTSTNPIEPGKHYIIASSKISGSAKGMGSQGDNNRAAVDVTVTTVEGKQIITEATGLYEFVISGPQTISSTDYYTIYDESASSTGYLYAPLVSDKNYLRTRNSISDDDKAIWTITIDGSSSVATVKTKATGRNWMRFNSTLFSCYSSGQSDIYIYKKNNDNSFTFYSPTTIASATIAATETYTVESGQSLNITSLTNNGTAANLIIEDGGQLITTSTGVKATVKKTITPSVAKTSNAWYAISSPIKDQVISTAVSGTHNVYRYDEENIEWEEYRNGSNSFSTFENGRGYLYRSTDGNIIFSEVLNAADVEYTLSYACGNNTYKGFNLIGNPYSHVIYKGVTGTAIPNGSILEDKYCVLNTDGTWTLTNDGTAIPSGTAILVQAKSASTLTIENTTSTGSKGRVNNDNIWFTIKNGDYSDAACIEFKEGHGFNKIAHYNENAPMLYINHNDENFASVDMSDDTEVINLNFKAATMGKYTLSLKANGSFNYLHLIDKLTGEDIDMLLDDEYSFIGAPSDDNNRFIVRLSYTPDFDDNSIFAYQSGSDILVNGAGELQIFDVMGRFVMSEHINGVQTINVPSQGVYIFRLIGTEVNTQKIVVR